MNLRVQGECAEQPHQTHALQEDGVRKAKIITEIINLKPQMWQRIYDLCGLHEEHFAKINISRSIDLSCLRVQMHVVRARIWLNLHPKNIKLKSNQTK